ncbi:MAG: cysteine hydrolase, partial [Rhodospirillales bacterium]|nr:cysteine hydrolase [Rhodospirillales bacterium]
VPDLAALVPPAAVVDKSRYSAFAEPQVHRLLQERGIDTLVVTGGETDVCVLATVLGAVDLGYRVVLTRNAICSVSDETHDALLTLYRNRFGQQIEVADIDTILDAWR